MGRDRVIHDGERLRLAGVNVVARVLEEVDSPASVVWQLPPRASAPVDTGCARWHYL
ncbi:MAG: hypothetical protein AB7Q16_17150 [Vicinamibacterales bacterium]